MHYESILQKYFGFPSFRGIQQEIVESIGSGKDTLGLMPTGGGKSITFQVPALAMDGVCIVVTPLISLMKDQVQHLRQRGILAACIHSGLKYDEILQILDNAVYGGVKFLYLSPERLSTSIFLAKVQRMKVCFITVDEAHCISQWGYDFRPSYLQIAELRKLLPEAPVLALTATATPQVVDDIMRVLQFDEPRVFRMSFKRENLTYVVRPTDDKESQLLHILRSVEGSAIIYVRSRQGTKDLSKFLEANDVSSTFYHAGLDVAVKDQRQDDWQQGKTRVMVATNAFGMGIDKPDVRLVVHMVCPDSLEAYFQEAGRAGRDGLRSYAVLLFSRGDRKNLAKHLNSSFPDKEYIRKTYDDLAYFFQLGIDDGEGATYEFDIDRFCHVFHHFPTTLLGALSALQRAGYIEYDLDPDSHPRCKFLVNRDDLYQLHGLSEIEENVITTLLRAYTGLFADFVYVEEKNLAARAGLRADQVRQILISLSQRHIIKYVPRRNVPVVYYTRQRIDSKRLHFDKSIFEDLREQMSKRIDAVLHYAESQSECRSSMLLRYFGDTDACDCGRCDVCLAMKGGVGKPKVIATKDVIIKALTDVGGAMHVGKVNELPIPKAELHAALQALHDEEIILVDGFMLRLNSKS